MFPVLPRTLTFVRDPGGFRVSADEPGTSKH
jgi:hypothetical protein